MVLRATVFGAPSKKWQKTNEQVWTRELTDADAWAWVNHLAKVTVSTTELASLLTTQLVEYRGNE
jgi:hypothetical protein